jgi:hypothetical protein
MAAASLFNAFWRWVTCARLLATVFSVVSLGLLLFHEYTCHTTDTRVGCLLPSEDSVFSRSSPGRAEATLTGGPPLSEDEVLVDVTLMWLYHHSLTECTLRASCVSGRRSWRAYPTSSPPAPNPRVARPNSRTPNYETRFVIWLKRNQNYRERGTYEMSLSC